MADRHGKASENVLHIEEMGQREQWIANALLLCPADDYYELLDCVDDLPDCELFSLIQEFKERG